MADIQILAGLCKGTKLQTPKGNNTRPTMGRIVENIFNILTHNKYIDNFSFKNQSVLDIFAGSGRLGLEALSRGADSAVFVDNNSDTRKIILDNIQKCRMSEKASFINCNATDFNFPTKNSPFTLVFCDAPYGKNLSNIVIKNLLTKGFLAHNALLCVETENDYTIDVLDGLMIMDKRMYGITNIHFLKYNLPF